MTSSPVKKIIIVGNDKYADKYNYNKIMNSKLSPVLIGINRFFYITNPHYLFFHDLDILREMMNNEVDFNNFNILTTNWIEKGIENKPQDIQDKLKQLKNDDIVTKYKREPNRFPDSVTTAIKIINNELYQDFNLEFYILGVSLKWDNKRSHFWRDKHNTYNNKSRKWYERRFKYMLNNFRELKNNNYNIYSCTPNSELNKLFPFKRIEYFYK